MKEYTLSKAYDTEYQLSTPDDLGILSPVAFIRLPHFTEDRSMGALSVLSGGGGDFELPEGAKKLVKAFVKERQNATELRDLGMSLMRDMKDFLASGNVAENSSPVDHGLQFRISGRSHAEVAVRTSYSPKVAGIAQEDFHKEAFVDLTILSKQNGDVAAKACQIFMKKEIAEQFPDGVKGLLRGFVNYRAQKADQVVNQSLDNIMRRDQG